MSFWEIILLLVTTRPLTRKARERGIGKYKIVHMFVFKMAKLSHRRARARAVRSPTVPAHRVRASPCTTTGLCCYHFLLK